jgi:hypothetical protein
MALRTSTRTTGSAAPEYSDRMFRCVMRDTRVFNPDGTVASGAIEIWGEWHVDQGGGRYTTAAARCDKAVEDEILALPNLPTALDKCAANTHPKVTP